MKPDTEPLPQIEQRLRRMLVQEAGLWSEREPQRLKAACRATRQAKTFGQRRHPLLWAGTSAAAASLVLCAARMFHEKTILPDCSVRPAVVSNIVDREALYAALPKIPVPTRPPAPIRLFAERIPVAAPNK